MELSVPFYKSPINPNNFLFCQQQVKEEVKAPDTPTSSDQSPRGVAKRGGKTQRNRRRQPRQVASVTNMASVIIDPINSTSTLMIFFFYYYFYYEFYLGVEWGRKRDYRTSVTALKWWDYLFTSSYLSMYNVSSFFLSFPSVPIQHCLSAIAIFSCKFQGCFGSLTKLTTPPLTPRRGIIFFSCSFPSF